MAAGPRAPAAGGGRRWQRRRSGRVEVAWSGQEASPRHEGASGVLDLGRGRKEERLHGEQGGGGALRGGGARRLGVLGEDRRREVARERREREAKLFA